MNEHRSILNAFVVCCVIVYVFFRYRLIRRSALLVTVLSGMLHLTTIYNLPPLPNEIELSVIDELLVI